MSVQVVEAQPPPALQPGAAPVTTSELGAAVADIANRASLLVAPPEAAQQAKKKAYRAKEPRGPCRAVKSLAATATDKPPDFVVKLYSMFSELGPDLITWNSGKIAIPGPSNKLAAVLPKYFRHGKFTSFQRQLNNFGFHKKISESSSKLRVYAREDMLGYPAEALLDLRRSPSTGCASWRRTDDDAPPPKVPKLIIKTDKKPTLRRTVSATSSLASAVAGVPAPNLAPGDFATISDDDIDPLQALLDSTEPIAGHDMDVDCLDDFLDFLDNQVCGPVLSTDDANLCKSTDLGLDIAFTDESTKNPANFASFDDELFADFDKA